MIGALGLPAIMFAALRRVSTTHILEPLKIIKPEGVDTIVKQRSQLTLV